MLGCSGRGGSGGEAAGTAGSSSSARATTRQAALASSRTGIVRAVALPLDLRLLDSQAALVAGRPCLHARHTPEDSGAPQPSRARCGTRGSHRCGWSSCPELGDLRALLGAARHLPGVMESKPGAGRPRRQARPPHAPRPDPSLLWTPLPPPFGPTSSPGHARSAFGPAQTIPIGRAHFQPRFSPSPLRLLVQALRPSSFPSTFPQQLSSFTCAPSPCGPPTDKSDPIQVNDPIRSARPTPRKHRSILIRTSPNAPSASRSGDAVTFPWPPHRRPTTTALPQKQGGIAERGGQPLDALGQ